MPQVIIATALLIEARAVARAFCLPSKFNHNVQKGEGSAQLSIALIGPRARHLDALRNLSSPPPNGIILAGLAGALSPELKLGDVVLDGNVPQNIPALPHRIFVGPITTSDTIVATPEQKSQMFRETNALAVDMESAPTRSLADHLQIPFLTIRAISDTATQPLSEDLLTLVDENGRPRTNRALALLAKHPSRLPELLALQRASKLALANLTATLQALVQAGWPHS